MLSQFSVIPPLSESALEVPSYVRPTSQSSPDQYRMPLGPLLETSIRSCRTANSAAVLGAQSASQKLGADSNGDRRSKANPVTLPRVQSRSCGQCD